MMLGGTDACHLTIRRADARICPCGFLLAVRFFGWLV